MTFSVQGKDQFILAVAFASILVYVRTLFRLAETADGLFSSTSTNETLFGVLEFMPVAIAISILAAWHPGRWLPLCKDQAQAESPMGMISGGLQKNESPREA